MSDPQQPLHGLVFIIIKWIERVKVRFNTSCIIIDGVDRIGGALPVPWSVIVILVDSWLITSSLLIGDTELAVGPLKSLDVEHAALSILDSFFCTAFVWTEAARDARAEIGV